MKKVFIKYNPYLISTEITIDGKMPKNNSGLNFGKLRIQEWAGKLPELLVREYFDKNISIEFTGTQADFEDLKIAMSEAESIISVNSYQLNRTLDVSQVEKEVDKIYADIQIGPIDELKSQEISEAFARAKNKRFEINVVACMNSGKSTLINALLGKNLMPARMEATTATIVQISNCDSDKFIAETFDADGKKLNKYPDLTYEIMDKLNDDERVARINIQGRIPCVSSTGMQLVIVDTPGTNNARDIRHKAQTYDMLRQNADTSMVLYVLAGDNLGSEDNQNLLDWVCECLNEGGKQDRDRFIFAVNKMDRFNPDPNHDGLRCIENALEKERKDLLDKGIEDPNLFPVTALVALQARTNDEEGDELYMHLRKMKRYGDVFHLERYTQFSHLPSVTLNKLVAILKQSSENEQIEIHSGVVPIEQAISLYINKYARTQKVNELVCAFNTRLEELSVIANLQQSIQDHIVSRDEVQRRIESIQEAINSNNNAITRAKAIEGINISPKVQQRVRAYIKEPLNMIAKMMMDSNGQVPASKAKQMVESLTIACENISAKTEVTVDSIIRDEYAKAIKKAVEEFKTSLKSLSIAFGEDALSFDPFKLVEGEVIDVEGITNKVSETKTEEYEDVIVKTRWIPSTRAKRAGRGAIWGGLALAVAAVATGGAGLLVAAGAAVGAAAGAATGKDGHEEKYEEKVKKTRSVRYVDMRRFANEYLTLFQKEFKNVEINSVKFVDEQSNNFKRFLEEKLNEINARLNSKLEELKDSISEQNSINEDIQLLSKHLDWINGIKQRVNKLVNF